MEAATVIGGAVVEALLLYRLKQFDDEEISGATEQFNQSREDRPAIKGSPDRWSLESLNIVAQNLGVLDEDAFAQANLVRRFRDLIHPGREPRLGVPCDRGTALAAAAAIELTRGRVEDSLSSITTPDD